MLQKKHTLSDAACWNKKGTIIEEFLDDSEFPEWDEDGDDGFQYPPAEVTALNIPLHPKADWYAVGYGSLVAVVADGTLSGNQISVWEGKKKGWVDG